MSYKDFLSQVNQVLTESLSRLGFDVPITLEMPPRPEMGDLAATVSFAIAKNAGVSPNEISKKIVDDLQIAEDGMIDHVEAAGPYVNFFVRTTRLAQATLDEIRRDRSVYGSSATGKGVRVLVEHTNVNPNKAIHIGHTRNSCLGDSLARILQQTGYDVQVANYVDDSGTQVADIVLGFTRLGFPLQPPEGTKFDQYCGDEVYVNVNRMYKEDPTLIEQRKEISKSIEAGEDEIAELSKKITTRVLKAQLETCWRIGVYFDLLNTETDILASGLWSSALEELKGTGIVTFEEKGDLAGCWVVKATMLPQFAEETDAVVVRSDGTTTYLGKDLAYAMWKLGLLKKDFRYKKFAVQPNGRPIWTTTSDGAEAEHPRFGSVDKAISVIDVRQSRPQEIIASGMKLMTGSSFKEYVHYGYEVVSLSSKTASAIGQLGADEEQKRMVHMEGRAGVFVNTDVVLDALVERAEDETHKRNLSADAARVRDISEKIAVGALRYNLTKVDTNKIIVFDLDDALDLEGETGPYIQYAHVRAAGILEKAMIQSEESVDGSLLAAAEEIDLIKELSKFPSTVEAAAHSLTPQRICRYAHRLAMLFNDFYEKHRVIGADRKELMIARLRLVECVKTVLENSLGLLGIPIPDAM